MDEVRFPVNFNDVDYCLKLRALGKRIVFTPHAKLVHLELASRGPDVRANHKERFERELQNLRTKWGNVLAADPYYNPMLSLDPIPFSALAWPDPRDGAAHSIIRRFPADSSRVLRLRPVVQRQAANTLATAEVLRVLRVRELCTSTSRAPKT